MPVTAAASSPSTQKKDLTESQQVTEEILAAGIIAVEKMTKDAVDKRMAIDKESAENSG